MRWILIKLCRTQGTSMHVAVCVHISCVLEKNMQNARHAHAVGMYFVNGACIPRPGMEAEKRSHNHRSGTSLAGGILMTAHIGSRRRSGECLA